MAIGTKDRSERATSEVGIKSVAGPGAKTGASGTDTKDKPKKKSKKKLIIGLVLLLVIGGALKFTVLAPKASGPPPKPVPGPIIAMDETTLNLTGGHYLRMKIALETMLGTTDALDTSQAAQLVIDEYSNLSVAQLTGQAARAKLLSQLVTQLQKAYPKEIMGAYYTEFVMTS